MKKYHWNNKSYLTENKYYLDIYFVKDAKPFSQFLSMYETMDWMKLIKLLFCNQAEQYLILENSKQFKVQRFFLYSIVILPARYFRLAKR